MWGRIPKGLAITLQGSVPQHSVFLGFSFSRTRKTLLHAVPKLVAKGQRYGCIRRCVYSKNLTSLLPPFNVT